MGIKIIFLDIDGVLATYPKEVARRPAYLNPERVGRLARLVDTSGAYVVISSSWRYVYDVTEMIALFTAAGWTDARRKVVSETPKGDGHRGTEITEWLDAHPDTTSYVILDDEREDLDGMWTHLVETDRFVGLTDDHVRMADNVLRNMPRCTVCKP